MQYYLRFLCYDDPSRKSGEQIYPDIPIDPKEDDFQFNYGDPVRVGPDGTGPKLWPKYVVAHLMLGEEVDDPHAPGKNALLFRVFLARREEGGQFETPPVILEIWEEEAAERKRAKK